MVAVKKVYIYFVLSTLNILIIKPKIFNEINFLIKN